MMNFHLESLELIQFENHVLLLSLEKERFTFKNYKLFTMGLLEIIL